MKNVIVLTGSVRPNNVSTRVASFVADVLGRHEGIGAAVVEVGSLELPFFDAPTVPSAEGYVAPHDTVRRWSTQVTEADAVVLVMPEYNHAMSAVQKNAGDWLYGEWSNKPVGLVGYGWYEGANVLANARVVMSIPKADVRAEVGLKFMQHLSPEGEVIDEATVRERIDALAAKLVD